MLWKLNLNVRRFKNDKYSTECFTCSAQVAKKQTVQLQQFTTSKTYAKLVQQLPKTGLQEVKKRNKYSDQDTKEENSVFGTAELS